MGGVNGCLEFLLEARVRLGLSIGVAYSLYWCCLYPVLVLLISSIGVGYSLASFPGPGRPAFCRLQATESWAEPGNEASYSLHCLCIDVAYSM